MRRFVLLSVVALVATIQPAAALWIDHDDGTSTYVPNGLIFFALFLGFLGFLGVVGFFGSLSTPSPPPREKTADEYNAEAILLAAKRHHTEMHTELRKAEIEAARMEAVHKERGEIIAHDRKVRGLNAKLDEKRRSS